MSRCADLAPAVAIDVEKLAMLVVAALVGLLVLGCGRAPASVPAAPTEPDTTPPAPVSDLILMPAGTADPFTIDAVTARWVLPDDDTVERIIVGGNLYCGDGAAALPAYTTEVECDVAAFTYTMTVSVVTEDVDGLRSVEVVAEITSSPPF